MGRDKAFLPYTGSTLLEHTLATLRQAGFSPRIAGLRSHAACSAPLVPDNYPECGPLGGIEAALQTLAGEPPQPVLFTPVDLPLLPPAFHQALFARARHSGALVTIPVLGGQPQPLCAVYSSGLATGIAQALQAGAFKVTRVLEQMAGSSDVNRFDYFHVEALATLHGWHAAHRWFHNVNTPHDWDALAPASDEPQDLRPAQLHLVQQATPEAP